MAEFVFNRSELKAPVLRLLAVLVVAAALVWLSDNFRAARQTALERARADLNRVRSEYRLAIEAGDIIQSSLRRYQDLQQRSFVGAEPRLLWIESLRNSGTARKLYNVQYNLRRQQPLMLQDFDGTEHYQLYASPMRLHLELAHEADLVRFFASLNKEQPAVYQIRGCSLAPMFDAKGVAMDRANVSADCELLWFTVRPLSEAHPEEQGELVNSFHGFLALICLALLAIPSTAAADPYGTLFTTPEQRARLDAARNGGTVAAVPRGLGQGAPAQPASVKLNGALVSSFGNKEVWVNGKARLEGTDATGSRVQVLNPDRVRLQTAPGAAVHDMKPGQVLDPASGHLSEAWQHGKTQQVLQE